MPLDCSNFAKEAAMIPLPREEVTPPVIKMYLVDEAIRIRGYYFVLILMGCKGRVNI
jgi:hypothetical protein